MKTGLNNDGEDDILGLNDFEVALLNQHIAAAKASELPEDPGDIPVRWTIISW